LQAYPNPNVARIGGLQSQGAEGEAVVDYCDPSTTPDLELSGFPLGKNALSDGIESTRSSGAPIVH